MAGTKNKVEAAPAGEEDVWILRKDQLNCLSSAVRQDLVDQLAGRGAMSIRELAAAIGMQPSAIYHHVRKLLAVDLVREAGTRVVNRKSEKLYKTPSRRMRVRRALEDPANAPEIRRIVEALCRQAERDFAGGLEAGGRSGPGPDRDLGFFRLIARPTPEALERLNGLLEDIAALFWEEADPDQRPIALTWVLAPKA